MLQFASRETFLGPLESSIAKLAVHGDLAKVAVLGDLAKLAVLGDLAKL